MAAFPTDALGVRFRYALNADLTALPSTWSWVDFTTDVDFTFDIESEIGAPDDASETNSSLAFTVRDNDGKYTIDNAESPLWPYWREGVPIEYAWDLGDGAGWQVQQIAYLGDSQIEWPANTPLRCVSHITAAGHFRRLGRDPDIVSALGRTIPSARRRKAFWGMEDAAGSRQAASFYPEVPPLSTPGAAPEFGTASLLPGAFSVATFKVGQSLGANFSTPTRALVVRVSCLLHANTIPSGSAELFSLPAGGGSTARYVLEIASGALRFRAYTTTGSEASGASSIGFTAQNTDLVWLDWDLEQIATGTVEWRLRTTKWLFSSEGTPLIAVATASGTWSGTLGGLTGIRIAPTAALDDIQVGMLAVTEPPLPVYGGFGAVLGWAGDTTTNRVNGMCGEFKVPVSVTSTALGQVMGPQIPGSLLDNLRNCQATDHGILTDHKGVVSYLALSELYNRAPVLTLSSLTRGQLGEMDPRRDDQRKVNVASASRPGGSTATVADEDDVLLSGRFQGSPISVNVASDQDLPNHAGWALAIGTQRGYDFKSLALKPHLSASLAPQMIAVTLGDRIAASSLPPQMPKGGLERIVRGRRTKLSGTSPRRTIEIDLALVPTDPYDAFILNSDRLDTSGTEVIVDATSAATLLTCQTAAYPATVTGATSIDLWAAGERVTLTAVVNETSGDPFTRTTANGLGSMPAGATVPAQPWTSVVSAGTGTTADFATTGAAATFAMQAAGTTLRAALDGLPMLNPDFRVSGSIPVVPTGNSIALTWQYRRGPGGGTDAYEIYVLIPTSGNPVMRLYAPGSVLIGELTLPFAHSASLVYWWHIAPVGSRHRARVWTGGLAAEPTYWMMDVQDSTRLKAGSIGMRGARGVANSNASPVTATWDDLTFAGVQQFTVTRGIAGFSKALPLGSQVKLWRGRGMGI